MKWIDVKDKIPNDNDGMCADDYVLVLSAKRRDYGSPGDIVSIAQWQDGKWEFAFSNEGVFSCVGTFDIESHDITHWMPIPNRYKKDKK